MQLFLEGGGQEAEGPCYICWAEKPGNMISSLNFELPRQLEPCYLVCSIGDLGFIDNAAPQPHSRPFWSEPHFNKIPKWFHACCSLRSTALEIISTAQGSTPVNREGNGPRKPF